VTPKPYPYTTRDRSYSIIRRIIDGFLNLVYPDVCLACTEPVVRLQDRGVCSACWEKTLQLAILPPVCQSCGLPLHTPEPSPTSLCGECTIAPPAYSGARSFGYYSAELRSLVQGLKFNGKKNLVGLLGPLLAATFSESWDRKEIDLIVPVPLHPRRIRQRGFNQAALLAGALAAELAISYSGRALIRVRHTPPQVGLSHAGRQENVYKAFQCTAKDRIAGKRVLLVDDVMTTGATVVSATQALLEGGALRVYVITIARAVPGS
jgi:ComF family protein